MPALAARKRRFIFVMFVLRWAPFPKRGKNGACHLIRYLGPFEPKVQARVGYYSPCCGKQSCFPYFVQLVQCRDAAARTYCGNLSRATMATVENVPLIRSEEHTCELQSLMRISYAVLCLKKKKQH